MLVKWSRPTYGSFHFKQQKSKFLEIKAPQLLPKIIDGSKKTHPLSDNAAKVIGLKAGTPVSLAYLDGLCSFLGSGGYEST